MVTPIIKQTQTSECSTLHFSSNTIFYIAYYLGLLSVFTPYPTLPLVKREWMSLTGLSWLPTALSFSSWLHQLLRHLPYAHFVDELNKFN